MAKRESIIVPDGCTRVLLHACCAPCSSAIVEWLLAHEIEPVIYYYNPNIYPLEEYEIRKNESKRHAEMLGIKWIEGLQVTGYGLQVTGYGGQVTGYGGQVRGYGLQVTGYGEAHDAWRHDICGLENEPERGKRCEACFYHRLLATARKAQELGIEWFATTLASSRWKNLDQINAAGLRATTEVTGYGLQVTGYGLQVTGYGLQVTGKVSFWAQNWRKDGLQERRNQLLKEYGFYNQTYCGCEFSMRAGTECRCEQSADTGTVSEA